MINVLIGIGIGGALVFVFGVAYLVYRFKDMM